jgi:hypothetical protein
MGRPGPGGPPEDIKRPERGGPDKDVDKPGTPPMPRRGMGRRGPGFQGMGMGMGMGMGRGPGFRGMDQDLNPDE